MPSSRDPYRLTLDEVEALLAEGRAPAGGWLDTLCSLLQAHPTVVLLLTPAERAALMDLFLRIAGDNATIH